MSNPPQYGPTALPQGANDGGDGSSLAQATWVAGSDKTKPSFIILQGKDYVRCNMGDALQFYDSGYRVFDPPTGRRVKFQYTQPGRPKFGAFEHQYWEIQMEEHASLVRGDRLPGEDLGEGKFHINREEDMNTDMLQMLRRSMSSQEILSSTVLNSLLRLLRGVSSNFITSLLIPS